ncbi:hypothetical protein GCM10028794_14320 [Silanimonas algicola]
MNDQTFGGIVLLASAIPALVVGVRWRSGQGLAPLGRRTGAEGAPLVELGRHLGLWMVVIGTIVVAMGLAVLTLPPRAATIATLALVVVLQWPVIRMALGPTTPRRH